VIPNGRKNSATTATTPPPSPKRGNCLYFAIKLCNELQQKRMTGRACFSVDDMRLLANAASTLREELISSNGEELIWAVLYCPELSRCILKALKTIGIAEFLTAKVACKDGCLDISAAIGNDKEGDEKSAGQFKIPLVGDNEFTGEQLIAAVASVFITYYWIEKKWLTDVAAYDNTMPQSVLMC